MVTLLGPRDELLRTMERAFPAVSIHVRGNEFHMTGRAPTWPSWSAPSTSCSW